MTFRKRAAVRIQEKAKMKLLKRKKGMSFSWKQKTRPIRSSLPQQGVSGQAFVIVVWVWVP